MSSQRSRHPRRPKGLRRKSGGARRFSMLASAALTLASVALQASPAQDYMLHCMGCHGTAAEGIPGKVPPLANALTRFMRTPAGRDYVLRVPGAANSALSDQQLAAVLNWLAVTFNDGASQAGTRTGDHAPVAVADSGRASPAPFTVEEVTRARHIPLPAVLAARNAVVRDLAASGPAPPAHY